MKDKPKTKATAETRHQFTVHFEVPYDVHELLTMLGRPQNTSPNDVAKNILMVWLRNTKAQIEQNQPAPQAEKPRIIIP